MALLAVAYFALPALALPARALPAAPIVVGALIGLSCAVAIVLAVRGHRPAHAGAWLMLAAGVAVETVTRTVYEVLPGPAGTVKPGMHLVDVLYATMFVLFLVGLLGLAPRGPATVDWAAII